MGNYFDIIYNLIWEKDIKDGIINNNNNNNNNNSNMVNDKQCNKILSSKQNLNKHLLICKGISNPLECHLCHKILSDRSSKSKHLKICK